MHCCLFRLCCENKSIEMMTYRCCQDVQGRRKILTYHQELMIFDATYHALFISGVWNEGHNEIHKSALHRKQMPSKQCTEGNQGFKHDR